MVHELDVRHATARCIDLAGSGNFNLGTTYTMQLSPNGKTLWAVSAGFGRVIGIDVATAKVRDAFRFKVAKNVVESPSAAVSAISADGSRIAIAVGGDLWLVNTPTQTVRTLGNHPATAVAFARDGRRLWVAQGTRLHALQL
jgi:DNA-binding beta-propeller fold protein YncE